MRRNPFHSVCIHSQSNIASLRASSSVRVCSYVSGGAGVFCWILQAQSILRHIFIYFCKRRICLRCFQCCIVNSAQILSPPSAQHSWLRDIQICINIQCNGRVNVAEMLPIVIFVMVLVWRMGGSHSATGFCRGVVSVSRKYIFSIDYWVHGHEEAINAFQLLIIMQILC